MDRKAALATAAGLVLVVAGAASALSSAWTAEMYPRAGFTSVGDGVVFRDL